MSKATLLKAGVLRDRCLLQEEVEVRQANGTIKREWVTQDILWADIEHLSGYKQVVENQQASGVTSQVTIRYRSGVKINMRFVTESGDEFVVMREPVDIEYRHILLMIDCKHRLAAET